LGIFLGIRVLLLNRFLVVKVEEARVVAKGVICVLK
jgi:hypothetical protein